MDLELTETGNGGDLVRKGNDLSVIFSFENMPYLALFGGNVAASTPVKRLESAQAFDFWGNALLMPNEPTLQFNSETERVMHQTALTSAGRLVIEEAIKKDLQFMTPFAEVTVSTEIIATDNLRIAIGLKEPDNLQEREFIYIWDAAKAEFVTIDYTPNSAAPEQEELQYLMPFYL